MTCDIGLDDSFFFFVQKMEFGIIFDGFEFSWSLNRCEDTNKGNAQRQLTLLRLEI